MTKEPTLEEQEQLADTRRRAAAKMARRELRIELSVDAAFLAVVALLFVLPSPQRFDPVAAVLSVGVMFLAIRVTFETPFGYTVASQLAFVPLLFCIPPAFVPLVMAAVMFAHMLPAVASAQAPRTRLLRCLANSWFSVGPALVFAITDVRPDVAGPAILAAALAAQFLTDFVAATAYFVLARRVSLRSQLSGSWVYLIDACLSVVALVVAEDLHEAPYVVLAVVPLLALLRMFANERRERLAKLLELNETYRGTALLLGDVITADDNYTGEHSEGVVGLALVVGDALGLDPERRRNLEFGAMLHDVGKITIPKEIINKPGKLDAGEWAIVKTHPAEGQRMLERVGGFMTEVGEIVRAHHERWDGGGYPDGLAGEAIPLEARIITCCDSWSAMRTDRPYRGAMSYEAAAAEMIRHAGTQFDAAVVEVMLPVLAASEGLVAAGDLAESDAVTASASELSSAAAQLAVPAAAS
ncbi:MAG TPA: HD-GYP domain-containing protein [Solirubrobacteraceae bacterium]|jgi:HD-GYP domain-containing protein (c-di-GMP phosphodiesterase class II)|nr:HD-GYP domain-containing protein [Solirubrobacteraceae bacterium]